MVPVWVLLFSASMWGLSSLPLKAFAEYGLSGPLLACVAFGGPDSARKILSVQQLFFRINPKHPARSVCVTPLRVDDDGDEADRHFV